MLISGFNEALNNIAAGYLKVDDESMSAIRFRTTEKGNLPHLYYISLNPEPPGTEFKNFACYVTRGFIIIEIHRGKEGTNNSKYQLQTG